MKGGVPKPLLCIGRIIFFQAPCPQDSPPARCMSSGPSWRPLRAPCSKRSGSAAAQGCHVLPFVRLRC